MATGALSANRHAPSAPDDELDDLFALVTAVHHPAPVVHDTASTSLLHAAPVVAATAGSGVSAAAVAPAVPDDLQRVSERALREAKARMDVAFNAATLRPGDAGYVYDRRVEFQEPRRASEWDE